MTSPLNLIRRVVNCRRGKHAWQYAAGETVNGRRIGPWRYCRACEFTTHLQAEPPIGHPESMTVELPPEQEAWLAALDGELWSKKAI